MKSIEEKAFEYCKKEICPTCNDNKTCIKTDKIGECIPTYMEYAAFLAGYKAAQEWISVEDELPSEIGQYLVKKLHGQITIMHFHAPFDSGKRIFQWWGFGRWNDQHKQVTHWKPIE